MFFKKNLKFGVSFNVQWLCAVWLTPCRTVVVLLLRVWFSGCFLVCLHASFLTGCRPCAVAFRVRVSFAGRHAAVDAVQFHLVAAFGIDRFAAYAHFVGRERYYLHYRRASRFYVESVGSVGVGGCLSYRTCCRRVGCNGPYRVGGYVEVDWLQPRTAGIKIVNVVPAFQLHGVRLGAFPCLSYGHGGEVGCRQPLLAGHCGVLLVEHVDVVRVAGLSDSSS